MPSLGENRGPYEFDFRKVRHRGVTVTTTVNTPYYENLARNEGFEYETGVVPTGVENRPDLISDVFYGTPKYWWLLMLVNNITDPFEGFNIGDTIKIPIIK